MQSEHPNVLSLNLRIASEDHADLRTSQHAKPDTRRFAGIFPLEVPEPVSVDSSDTTHEEHSDTSDDPSRWELVALDKNASITQVTSVESVGESSTPSAAQQIVACYRAVYGSDRAPECSTTEIKEQLSQVPDDRRSMYTLAASADVPSTMDMMWKPKPKVHMRRTDQRALIQAQSQAIAMMHNAGLKPTNKIQCRRRGCADILPDVEALKYHIHIHNIADTTARCNDAFPPSAGKSSVIGRSASISKTSKKSHTRSKSSFGTQQRCSTPYSPRRKLSAGSLLPSLFSPRESTPDVQHAPSITAVAKAFVSDPSPSKSAGPLPVRNNDETSSTHPSAPSRGRRTRNESMVVSECSPRFAVLLSPSSSPDMHSRLILTPHANLHIPLAFSPGVGGENDDRVIVPNENVHSVSEKLTGSRNPMRALSPTRAMSPIRNGIRRVLSIGCSIDAADG